MLESHSHCCLMNYGLASDCFDMPFSSVTNIRDVKLGMQRFICTIRCSILQPARRYISPPSLVFHYFISGSMQMYIYECIPSLLQAGFAQLIPWAQKLSHIFFMLYIFFGKNAIWIYCRTLLFNFFLAKHQLVFWRIILNLIYLFQEKQP